MPGTVLNNSLSAQIPVWCEQTGRIVHTSSSFGNLVNSQAGSVFLLIVLAPVDIVASETLRVTVANAMAPKLISCILVVCLAKLGLLSKGASHWPSWKGAHVCAA